jgi:GNAT superfamily N-acetyltransferase
MSLAEIARLEEGRQALGVAEVAAVSEEIGGGRMSFDAPDSWANQACALGLDRPVTEAELDRLVAFYVSRGVEPVIEVCPFADASLVDGLARRAFSVRYFENVMARPLAPDEALDATLDVELVAVDVADQAQVRAFIEVSTSGFRPLDQPVPESLFELSRRVVEHPRCESYLALIEGQPVGGGTVEILPPLAALFGTSVLPGFRRRGVQGALIRRRLAHARGAGCTVATIQSRPGIPTERNALRAGFSVIYTKVTMVQRAATG